jgi:hypothetical protein
MALNFPNSPTLNQVYTDATSGFSYQWNGTVWISFGAASSNQIKILDDISGSFTGIAFTFALTSSSISISPPNKQSLIINLGGVIQDPSDDYIVSGSNIIFSTAPSSALSFSGVSLGPAIPVSTILDGTVTGGSFTVAGILSTTNLYVAGVSTFVGLATHTGTIFGSNLSLTGVATATTLKVGTGVTISSGVVTATTFVGALTGNATGLSGTPNITVGNIVGAALTLSGGLSVGVATATTSIVVAGIVTTNSSGIDLGGTILNKSELKNYTETVYAQGNTGTSTTLNLVNGNVFTATLTGNCTFTFTTGVTSGAASFTLILTNDATAGRSITWPVAVKWPNNTIPVRTTTANATDIWSFFTPNNGTTWYGNVALYNFT